MCGGCNIWAESAGVSLIVARYWWVARQGRKAVAEATAIAESGATPVPAPGSTADRAFVDPLDDVTRLIKS